MVSQLLLAYPGILSMQNIHQEKWDGSQFKSLKLGLHLP